MWDICDVMGWKDMKTARNYLAKLGVIAKKFNKKNDKNKSTFLFNETYRYLSKNKMSKQETCKKISYEENVWLNRYLKQ